MTDKNPSDPFDFCKYRHIFGIEGQGAHSYRLFNIAIVDFVGTIILGIILSKITHINIYISIIIMFLLGILLHKLFCVKSTVNVFLDNISSK